MRYSAPVSDVRISWSKAQAVGLGLGLGVVVVVVVVTVTGTPIMTVPEMVLVAGIVVRVVVPGKVPYVVLVTVPGAGGV